MGIWYVTREAVKSALDIAETARNNVQIDRAIAGATDAIHGLTHRQFYPTVATRSFDWPTRQYAPPWRFYLESNELISATTVTSGGVVIPTGDYVLRRSDDVDEPPYTVLEINRGSSAAFSGGPDTPQRSLVVAGVFGSCATEVDAGQLTASVPSATVNTVDVTDSAAIGVGDLIRIDSERMQVTGKIMSDVGVTVSGTLDALNSAVTVPVADGTAFAYGETILVDAERMLIEDIAGNNLIVQRAWDGSVLAAHLSLAAIYVSRRLIVTRGAYGTTADAHSDNAPIARHDPYPLVRELALAEATTTLIQESSGFARTAGSGDSERETTGKGLIDIRARVLDRWGRKARMAAI